MTQQQAEPNYNAMTKKELVERLEHATSHFKDTGITIECTHVAKGTPPINFEGVSFNLGDRAFVPCQRCYVALREAVLTDVVRDAFAMFIRNDRDLRFTSDAVIKSVLKADEKNKQS